MVFAGWLAIVVGALMIGQWVFFVITNNVPELKTEPIRTWGHIAAEFVTAVLLIAGGIGLLAETRWAQALALFAYGMLVYTLIVSPMYFVQKRVWPIAGMFGVIILLTLISLYQIFQSVLST